MDLNATSGNATCTMDTEIDSVVFPILYMLIFVISLTGNCLSIYVARMHIARDNEIGVYLLNLSAADILYTFTIPYLINVSHQSENVAVSNFFNIMMFTTMYLSPAFLCCISVDRYLAVAHPLRYMGLRTVRCACIVSGICWALELGCHLLLLWIRQDLFSTFFTTEVYEDKLPMPPSMVMEYSFRFVSGFCLPLAVMLFSSQQIFKAVNQSISTLDSEKRKIGKLLLILILVYFISLGPYQMIMLARCLVEPGNCEFAQSVNKFYKISFILTGVNCAADPVLYCFFCKAAKLDVLNLYRSFKNKFLSTLSTSKSRFCSAIFQTRPHIKGDQ